MSTPQESQATMYGRRSDGSVIRRPLSPHMQVYDMLQMTSALSISHRITGVAWCVGLIVMVWWLVAAASGPTAFATVQAVLGSWIGMLFLIGMTAAAWFHTLNGVRHVGWDAGWGYRLPEVYRSGWLVLIGTAVLTGLTWLVALVSLGARG